MSLILSAFADRLLHGFWSENPQEGEEEAEHLGFNHGFTPGRGQRSWEAIPAYIAPQQAGLFQLKRELKRTFSVRSESCFGRSGSGLSLQDQEKLQTLIKACLDTRQKDALPIEC